MMDSISPPAKTKPNTEIMMGNAQTNLKNDRSETAQCFFAQAWDFRQAR